MKNKRIHQSRAFRLQEFDSIGLVCMQEEKRMSSRDFSCEISIKENFPLIFLQLVSTYSRSQYFLKIVWKFSNPKKPFGLVWIEENIEEKKSKDSKTFKKIIHCSSVWNGGIEKKKSVIKGFHSYDLEQNHRKSNIQWNLSLSLFPMKHSSPDSLELLHCHCTSGKAQAAIAACLPLTRGVKS